MHTEFLMGNEAIAMGALAAGVNVVCGYPGTPSSEVISLSGDWQLKSRWTDIIYEGEVRTIEIDVNGFSASWQWGDIGSH